MINKKDENFEKRIMKKTFSLAKKANPSPNPYVGAIILKNNKIIGYGYHKKAGMAHAEIEAINSVKKRYPKTWKQKLEGSSLYVNLEPCNHYGRTPPCTKAIIEHKIKKVVFAMKDINKSVKGNGALELKKSGIIVKEGILEKEAQKLNEAYIKVQKTKMPLVLVKLAISLDGKIATKNFESKWISSEKSRQIVNKLRAESDAILIGIGTLKKDNPSLDVKNKKLYKYPLKVIVTSYLDEINGNERVFSNGQVLIAYNKVKNKKHLVKLSKRKINLIRCPQDKNGIDLKYLLKHLAKIGCNKILCEGGGKIATSLLKKDFVDYLILFYAPKIIGNDGIACFSKLGIKKLSQAYKFRIEKIKKVDTDVMIILKRLETNA